MSIDYSFSKKDNPNKIEKIIRTGILEFKNTVQIRNDLKDKGVKIRKQDILKDIRFLKAEYNIKKEKIDNVVIQTRYLSPDIQKIQNKQKWMQNVFEPIRKEYGLNSKQASKIVNDKNLTSQELIRFAKLQKDYWDKYKKAF